MKLKTHRNIVCAIAITFTLAAGGVLHAAPPRSTTPRPHKTLVGCRVKGRLLIQPASGGALHSANTEEKKEWEHAKPEEGATAPNSASYFVHPTDKNEGGGVIEYDGKVVVRAGWLKKIVPDTNMAGGWPVYIEGWFPDARHFSLTGNDSNSSSITSSRLVVDAATGHSIPFNGWVEPTMKRGVLPTGNNYKEEGVNGLYVEKPFYKRGRMEDDGRGGMEYIKSFESNPSLTRYVIIPVPKPISRFRSLAETKGAIPLTLNGVPFTFQTDEDRQGTLPHFVFSSDGQWGLCTHDKRGSVLFSMTTGRGRILPDKEARFVEPFSEECPE